MIHSLCAVLCAWGLSAEPKADDLRVLPAKVDGVVPQAMMHAYWMHQVGEALNRRAAEYEKLKTPEQWASHQERMRKFFVAQLGGFPERTPLEPQRTGRLERDGYAI